MKNFIRIVIALCILAPLAALTTYVATEYQWFASVGHASVYTIGIAARLICWGAFTLIGFLTFGLCARAMVRKLGIEEEHGFRRLLVVLCFGFGALSSVYVSHNWMTFRLAVSGSRFGVADPFTHLDAGFFVFTLPALQLIVSWLIGVIMMAALVVVGVAFFGQQRAPEHRNDTLLSLVSADLYRIAGAFTLTAAFSYVLKAFAEVSSQSGPLPGISEVDARIVFPGSLVIAGVGVIVAIIIFASLRSHAWKRCAKALGIWAVLGALILMVAPAVLTTFVIKPNELTRERPYLQHAIDMTRRSYELDHAVVSHYPATANVAPMRVKQAKTELGNARIWTPASVKQAFAQLETVRPYYKLSSIQYDRYTVGGTEHAVLVSAREINTKGLPKSAQNWINTHLIYTHGFGMSVASSARATSDGFPDFLVGDVPAVRSAEASTSAALITKQPRIYFGERTKGYAVVNTTAPEFDYPGAKTGSTPTYRGTGIVLNSPLKRLTWATRLGSLDLLISGYLTPHSTLLVNRSLKARAQKLAPWLHYYGKPYPALVKGHIVWILDGYTSSTNFPYAATYAHSHNNYLRNSVKVVMDASSGKMTFYAFGVDPIRDAWARIYPGVITSASTIAPELAAHFKYPKKLFDVQTSVYRTYHMQDATTFYNKEDKYGAFKNADGSKFSSTYTPIDAADTGTAAYSIVCPLSVPGKDNMVSILAASCEPSSYGTLTNYALPRDRVVLGPGQIRARIQQDPEIAQQLALWSQNGNTLVYGDMLVLPVQRSIVYVEPIFLKAKKSAITELAGTVVVSNNHVRMGATIDDALDKTWSKENAAR